MQPPAPSKFGQPQRRAASAGVPACTAQHGHRGAAGGGGRGGAAAVVHHPRAVNVRHEAGITLGAAWGSGTSGQALICTSEQTATAAQCHNHSYSPEAGGPDRPLCGICQRQLRATVEHREAAAASAVLHSGAQQGVAVGLAGGGAGRCGGRSGGAGAAGNSSSSGSSGGRRRWCWRGQRWRRKWRSGGGGRLRRASASRRGASVGSCGGFCQSPLLQQQSSAAEIQGCAASASSAEGQQQQQRQQQRCERGPLGQLHAAWRGAAWRLPTHDN